MALFDFGTEQYGVTTGLVAWAAYTARSLGCSSIAVRDDGLLEMGQPRTGAKFRRFIPERFWNLKED